MIKVFVVCWSSYKAHVTFFLLCQHLRNPNHFDKLLILCKLLHGKSCYYFPFPAFLSFTVLWIDLTITKRFDWSEVGDFFGNFLYCGHLSTTYWVTFLEIFLIVVILWQNMKNISKFKTLFLLFQEFDSSNYQKAEKFLTSSTLRNYFIEVEEKSTSI